jgi:hypothetical protein
MESWYGEVKDEPFLSSINHTFLTRICEMLGIKTRISWSMDYGATEGRSERLLHICRAAGATSYLSGPSAKNYLDESLFQSAGIQVEWMAYDGYPEYPQLHGPFEHGVTVLDLIFNEGPEAPRFMKSFRLSDAA